MSDDIHQIDVHVGRRIRLERKARGLSQQFLAAKLGITFQQVQKYERGANRISASKLLQTARALDVPVERFFLGLPNPVHDGSHQDDTSIVADALFAKPAGLELARAFVLIRSAPVQRRLVDLANALGDVAESHALAAE